jgi:hypothetical protein
VDFEAWKRVGDRETVADSSSTVMTYEDNWLGRGEIGEEVLKASKYGCCLVCFAVWDRERWRAAVAWNLRVVRLKRKVVLVTYVWNEERDIEWYKRDELYGVRYVLGA